MSNSDLLSIERKSISLLLSPPFIHHLLSAAAQYYKQTPVYRLTLHYMNTTLTGLFTLECMMKIFAFGFRVRS